MLEESTTIRAILTKMRKVGDEPLSDGFQKMAAPAPELHVVTTDRSITDIASVASGGAPPQLPDKMSGLQTATASGTLEAIFASAIREVIPTLVQRWVNSHEAELSSAFGAVVQRWMDERLPKVVENNLKTELRGSSAEHSIAR